MGTNHFVQATLEGIFRKSKNSDFFTTSLFYSVAKDAGMLDSTLFRNNRVLFK